MKKCLSIALLLISFYNCNAQTNIKRNTIYLEAGGTGLFGSIQYERQLTKHNGLGVRLGIGFYSEKAFYLTLPIGINYLFPLKNKNSFIDAGLGVTFTNKDAQLFNSNSNNFTSFVPSIGYRKHTTKNVMWRASISPIINKHDLFPWIGVSIGKIF